MRALAPPQQLPRIRARPLSPPPPQGCRDPAKAAAVAAELQLPEGSFTVLQVDLADLNSVARFADAVLALPRRLDALVCNGGGRRGAP